jgi:hypothetical protein
MTSPPVNTHSTPEPAPASGASDRRWTVLVRFADQKITQRLMPNGNTTRKRVHAAIFTSAERAEQVAGECQTYLDEHYPGSRAWTAPF